MLVLSHFNHFYIPSRYYHAPLQQYLDRFILDLLCCPT